MASQSKTVVRAEIFALGVFLQRGHPGIPPWFCVNLLALSVFICLLPSCKQHGKPREGRFPQSHLRNGHHRRAWLGLSQAHRFPPFAEDAMAIIWRLNSASELMRSQSSGLPLKFFLFCKVTKDDSGRARGPTPLHKQHVVVSLHHQGGLLAGSMQRCLRSHGLPQLPTAHVHHWHH